MQRNKFLGAILSQLFDRRSLMRSKDDERSIEALCDALLAAQDDVSGVKIAATVLGRYGALTPEEKAAFYVYLNSELDIDAAQIAQFPGGATPFDCVADQRDKTDHIKNCTPPVPLDHRSDKAGAVSRRAKRWRQHASRSQRGINSKLSIFAGHIAELAGSAAHLIHIKTISGREISH